MVTFKFYKGKYLKKYKVEVYRSGKKIKTAQFGDQRYGQYQDKTPLKLYKKKDTLDKERRRLHRLATGIALANTSPIIILVCSCVLHNPSVV